MPGRSGDLFQRASSIDNARKERRSHPAYQQDYEFKLELDGGRRPRSSRALLARVVAVTGAIYRGGRRWIERRGQHRVEPGPFRGDLSENDVDLSTFTPPSGL